MAVNFSIKTTHTHTHTHIHTHTGRSPGPGMVYLGGIVYLWHGVSFSKYECHVIIYIHLTMGKTNYVCSPNFIIIKNKIILTSHRMK